jgi:hypothetical protein
MPALVGAVAALVAGAIVFGVETHLFPGADALVGVLGAVSLGYAAKTLATLGLTRPAPPAEPTDDD